MNTLKHLPVFFILLLLFAPGQWVGAQSVWNGVPGISPTTNWSRAGNWTPSGVPGQATNVVFNNTATAADSTTINNVVDAGFAGRISSLAYTNTSGYENTLIVNGVTLNITGSGGLTNGSTLIDPGAGSAGTTTTISGAGGTLNVSNINASIYVGWATAGSSAPGPAILNMTNLDTFTATISRLSVGQNAISTLNYDNGIIYLAKTNIITAGATGTGTAAAIVVGDNSNNPGNSSYLYLGLTNAIYANNIGCALRKETFISGIMFNPSFTNNHPVAYFRGNDGVSPVTYWAIADGLAATGTARETGICDFSGGTVNAVANAMVLARPSTGAIAGYTSTGTLTMTAGTISVVNLTNAMLTMTTNAQIATGTINVNGTGTLAIYNLVLGAVNGFPGTALGTLNITNGTVAANTIIAGGGTSTINLNGGTLIVTNTAGTPAAPLTALNLTSASLHLDINPSAKATNIVATTVETSGTTTITIDSISGTPASATFPLINYTGTDPYPNLALNPTLPAGYISGNLVDDTINNTIDLGVTPVTLPTPTFSNLTASQTIAYGTTNIALSGKVSASGPVYPASGETITVTINGNAQTTTINNATGDFSINYNPSTIPASGTLYTITYSYAGDASLNGANNTSTTLTIGKAGLFALLTGDHTTINSDWSATENGIHYDTASNGIPYQPWIVTTQAFVGTKSIGIQVPAGNDANRTKQRFEYKIMPCVDDNGSTNAPNFQNARYCGFAFMLVGSPPLPITNSIIFWQGWQGAPWGPPAHLKFVNDHDASPPYDLELAIANLITGPTGENVLWNNRMIYPNTWYTVVIYIQPCYQTGITNAGYNTNGNISLWINGTNMVNWTGEIGYDPTKLYSTNDGSITTNTSGSAGVFSGFDIKDGIYAPDANNGHTIYFDEIAVADNYAAACPVRPPTVTNFAVTNGISSMSVIGDTVANYAGTATANYSLLTSTNLINWTVLATTNPASLPFSFKDTSGGTKVKFYRASVWPW